MPQVSALATLVVAAQVIITLFGLLYVSTNWPDSALGQAAGVLTNG